MSCFRRQLDRRTQHPETAPNAGNLEARGTLKHSCWNIRSLEASLFSRLFCVATVPSVKWKLRWKYEGTECKTKNSDSVFRLNKAMYSLWCAPFSLRGEVNSFERLSFFCFFFCLVSTLHKNTQTNVFYDYDFCVTQNQNSSFCSGM